MIIYNNKKQTIQGVKITNNREYLQLKSMISAHRLEGFNPVANDIKHLLAKAHETNADFNELYKQLFE